MRLLHYSAGLALCALLFAACQTTTVANCDPTTGNCPATTCTGTLRDCKNGAADGCETDSAADVDNCGACGTKCPMPANGEAACIDGVCGVRTCGTRFKDCNTSPTDGCEVDTFRDANNCGACGNVCAGGANATGVCIQGKCQLACQAAYLDCNKDPADGCETNGASDIANCGNCGNQCTSVGATNAACASGTCISTMCTGTYQTCKAGPINGCETDTATNVSNCGSCSHQCAAPANATAGCAASNCGIGQCNPGYGDCDNAVANGCETNTTNNVNHCSGCGKACPALPNASVNCVSSTCGLNACNAGYGNCDNVASNGCEVDVTSDAKNCAMCGNACPAPANATPGCAASACGIGMCNAGYGNCDNVAANGCETNLTNDAKNCTACGKACPAPANATASCVASLCGIGMCSPGYADCDKAPANGCEVNTNTDNNNCGACGKVCTGTSFCSAGACINDPCVNYGGTLVSLNAHIKICSTHMTWGSWDVTKIPTPWNVCNKVQWAAYSPPLMASDVPGLPNAQSSWLWIDNDSCGGGSHREVADTVYPFNDAGCYDGAKCCNSDTQLYLMALCTP